MRQLNDNTNKRKWIQITYDVRVKIEKLFKKGKSAREIALCVGYSTRTIQRELKRGMVEVTYTKYMDNGCEFLCQEGIERSITTKSARTKVYYCHPYRACERGSNENANKMIRRFILKGADISKFSDKDIQRIENYMNNYPRKILGGLSARQAA